MAWGMGRDTSLPILDQFHWIALWRHFSRDTLSNVEDDNMMVDVNLRIYTATLQKHASSLQRLMFLAHPKAFLNSPLQ